LTSLTYLKLLISENELVAFVFNVNLVFRDGQKQIQSVLLCEASGSRGAAKSDPEH